MGKKESDKSEPAPPPPFNPDLNLITYIEKGARRERDKRGGPDRRIRHTLDKLVRP